MAPGMEADDAQDLLGRFRAGEEEAGHRIHEVFRRVARHVLDSFSSLTPTDRDDARVGPGLRSWPRSSRI
jgi:hypothetical protein